MVCDKVGVWGQLKGSNTIKDILVVPKYKNSITNKGGVIYRYKCDHPECTVEYISETGRNFGDRYMEHLRAPSPIHNHANTRDYSIKLHSFCIVERGSQGITRTLKEAMFMRVNDPTMISSFSTSPSQSNFDHLPIKGHKHITLVLPGVPPCPYWCQIFPLYFGTKIGKYSIFP